MVLCKIILLKGNNVIFKKIGAVWAKKAEKLIVLTIFSALKIVGVKVYHRHDPKVPHSILGIDQFHVLRYCFLNNALCLCGS